MSHLSLTTLGMFQVTLDGDAIVDFKSNKVRALLVYLAIEAARPHSRDVLADLLWPNKSNPVALSSLRNALSNLRHVLPSASLFAEGQLSPFLEVTHGTVQFNLASDTCVDAVTFAQHVMHAKSVITSGRESRVDPSNQQEIIDCLHAAVDMYSGSFLNSFSVDSAPFEEWVLIKREEYHRLCMEAHQLLANHYETIGEFEHAQISVRHLLNMEPWQEEAHQQMMRILCQRNQRSAAMAQYRACRRVLKTELGVEPGPETTTLYESICLGQTAVAPAETLRPVIKPHTLLYSPPHYLSPPALDVRRPLLARQHEMARLHDLLNDALLGQGRMTFVVGDAGSGKTALLSEFRRHALEAKPDLICAGSACRALWGIGDPYAPFREILQTLGGDFEIEWTGEAPSPEHIRRLWSFLPTVMETLVTTGPDLIGGLMPAEALALRVDALAPWSSASSVSSVWRSRLAERARLASSEKASSSSQQMLYCEQVVSVLQALACHQPLLLTMDNLQWADNCTVSLLLHLGRNLVGQRILVLGAYRPSDIASVHEGDRHPLEFLVHELRRNFGDSEIDLNLADGRLFVDSLLEMTPNRLGPTFRQELYDHTRGHPLFTIEFVKAFMECRSHVRDEAGVSTEEPEIDWETLPSRVEATIAERIDRLPSEWQALLSIASVEGEIFTAEVLAQLSGMTHSQILWRLSDQLSKHHRMVYAQGLRRIHPTEQRQESWLSHYRFAHVLFQKYLYNRLDETVRVCMQ
jgi:DNA-binding SARP family transcriptional activator